MAVVLTLIDRPQQPGDVATVDAGFLPMGFYRFEIAGWADLDGQLAVAAFEAVGSSFQQVSAGGHRAIVWKG